MGLFGAFLSLLLKGEVRLILAVRYVRIPKPSLVHHSFIQIKLLPSIIPVALDDIQLPVNLEQRLFFLNRRPQFPVPSPRK